VKRLVHRTVAFLVSMISAAGVAYVLAHIAHYNLGVPAPALREQALICAALVCGLVTIEFLSRKE
jgi:hypothetical protein